MKIPTSILKKSILVELLHTKKDFLNRVIVALNATVAVAKVSQKDRKSPQVLRTTKTKKGSIILSIPRTTLMLRRLLTHATFVSRLNTASIKTKYQSPAFGERAQECADLTRVSAPPITILWGKFLNSI